MTAEEFRIPWQGPLFQDILRTLKVALDYRPWPSEPRDARPREGIQAMSHRPNESFSSARLKSLLLLQGQDLQEKILGIAALFICLELVFFKFLPDLSTALVQNAKSPLADFATFHESYLTPGTVFYPRFLGNWILIATARLLEHSFHSDDVRLHPLRVAAGLLTPFYAYIGAILAIQAQGQYSWRHFLGLYSVAAIMGSYVFYPGDMPSFALLSIALYCMLCERMAWALVFTLLTGLFRETSLHAVFFVLVWALSTGFRSPIAKLGWLVAFAGAFASEYVAIRHFFPGPVSSVGGFIIDPRALLQEMRSLTTICSLGLAVIFAAACLTRLQNVSSTDWRFRFFRLNCFAFPFWILFYRMLNGNIAEFRLLWPVILPCIYGVAYTARMPARPRGSVTAAALA